MSRLIKPFLFIVLIISWNDNTALAQPDDFNHPELDWYSIKTEHFEVHFHNGVERTAKEIARIAEEIYAPITDLYGYKGDKPFHFIVRDHDDYSNGAAYFYDNKIEIWATPMDFDLRGTHPWLLGVVTHEFTHMISLDQSKKFGDHIPALYFQYIGYEQEIRPDVLYGFPNRIVSFPFAGAIIPPWFAEGIAQFQSENTSYDFWDTHRDMILRTAVLDHKMLSYNEMSSFGHTSLGNEQVYNSGFSLVNYISENYGSDTIAKITRGMKSPLRINFNSAVKKVLGKSIDKIYDEWKNFLECVYQDGTKQISKNENRGVIIEKEGFGNFYPVWAPINNQVAYVSNKGREHFSPSSLTLYDFDKKEFQEIKSNVQYSPAFSPEGKQLAYVKKHRYDRFGSTYFELFIYDLESKQETRITHGGRLRNPNWSPVENKIVCVTGKDGTDNIVIVNPSQRTIHPVTRFKNGEQIFRPSWSPDGKRIVFDISNNNGRDIAMINKNGDNFRYLIQDASDSRTPVFNPIGGSIFFSWDKSGIFNIYELDLESNESTPLTNVIGGAFMPSYHPQRGLAYSLYTSDGYKIAYIADPKKLNEFNYLAKERLPRSTPVTEIAQTNNGNNGNSSIGYNQENDNPDVEKYKNTYGVLNLFPRVMVDYNTLKLGSYFASSEVLNKYSILGGFVLNRSFDMDLFGIIQYRKFYPTIFVEVYNQTRHTEDNSDKFKYNLLEVDLGLELKLNTTNTIRGMFVYSRYDGKITTQQGNNEVRFSYTYFLGSDFSLEWRHEGVARSRTSVINPRFGRRFTLKYDRLHNKFIKGFEINRKYSTVQEVFKPFNYNQFNFDWSEFFSLPWKHGLEFHVRGGFIDKPVESFFNLFAGGLLGLKGYPYYSIEGRKLLNTSLSYRFKISDNLGVNIPPFQFDKLYAGLFVDFGNAWNEGSIQLDDFKKDVGFQIRVDTFAFYNFPMRLFFDGAYGFDEITNRNFKYGKEWRFYFGFTFDYLD